MNAPTKQFWAVAIALSSLGVMTLRPSPAAAGLISTTDAAEFVAAPASVKKGAWESDQKTRVFQEQSGFTLLQDIQVNICDIGAYTSPESCTSGTIKAGTIVDSYFVHQDAIGRRGNIFLQGSITFDQDILGVIVETEELDATDPLLGAAGTLYPTGSQPLRHLDFPRAMDRIIVTPDRRTICFDLQTQVALDHIRIITASGVPGPGSAALLLAAGLTAWRPRRRTV